MDIPIGALLHVESDQLKLHATRLHEFAAPGCIPVDDLDYFAPSHRLGVDGGRHRQDKLGSIFVFSRSLCQSPNPDVCAGQ